MKVLKRLKSTEVISQRDEREEGRLSYSVFVCLYTSSCPFSVACSHAYLCAWAHACLKKAKEKAGVEEERLLFTSHRCFISVFNLQSLPSPFPPSRSHAAVFNLVYLPCTLPIPVFLLSWGYHLSLCWTTTPGGGFLWCVACPPHLPQPTWMPWIFFSRS